MTQSVFDVPRIGVAAALLWGWAATAAAAPPPAPGPFSTRAAAIAGGAGLGACQDCPITVGTSSSAATPREAGAVMLTSATPGALRADGADTYDSGPYQSAAGGARVDDYLYVDAPMLADGAPVPMRVTIHLSAYGNYSVQQNQALPAAGVSMVVADFGPPLAVGLGIGRYGDYYEQTESLDIGLANRSWTPFAYFMNAYVDIYQFSWGSAVAVGGKGSISITPRIGNSALKAAAADEVSVFSASGYDYTAPVPEPAAALLWLAGGAVLLMRRHHAHAGLPKDRRGG